MKNIKRYLLTAGILYQSVMSFAQSTAQFTVNGSAVSTQSPLQCFTNNSLLLEDQSQNASLYTINIYDATFTNLLYSTGAFSVNGSLGEIDVRNLCSIANNAACTAIPATATGTFGISETTATGPNDPNPSTYQGLITLSYPSPVTSSFTINNNAVNTQTPLILNGPQSLELEFTGNGNTADWRVDVLDPNTGNLLYTTDDVSGQNPSTIDMWNMCNGSQSSACSSLNAQVTGTFMVRLYESCCSAGDPDASIYSGLVTINPAVTQPNGPLSAAFTINNENVSPQYVTSFFNCNSIILEDASTGPYTYARVDVLDDAMQNTLYSTDYFSVNPQNNSYNLLNLCTNNQNSCSSLSSSSTGAYAIRYITSTVPYDNIYASAYTGLIYINPTITAANISFLTSTVTNSNSQDIYLAANTNTAAPDLVGRNSTVFELLNPFTNKAYVSSYSLALSSWNTTTNSWNSPTWTQSFTNDNSNVGPYQVPLSVLGGNGFLSSTTNAANNSMWKLDVTLANACGNFAESEFFEIDDTKQ